MTIPKPENDYVLLRVSGLDALEDGVDYRLQWRVYLDMYSWGEDRVLSFDAPTHMATAMA